MFGNWFLIFEASAATDLSSTESLVHMLERGKKEDGKETKKDDEDGWIIQ